MDVDGKSGETDAISRRMLAVTARHGRPQTDTLPLRLPQWEEHRDNVRGWIRPYSMVDQAGSSRGSRQGYATQKVYIRLRVSSPEHRGERLSPGVNLAHHTRSLLSSSFPGSLFVLTIPLPLKVSRKAGKDTAWRYSGTVADIYSDAFTSSSRRAHR